MILYQLNKIVIVVYKILLVNELIKEWFCSMKYPQTLINGKIQVSIMMMLSNSNIVALYVYTDISFVSHIYASSMNHFHPMLWFV